MGSETCKNESRDNESFHPLEHYIPTVGIKSSTPWNKCSRGWKEESKRIAYFLFSARSMATAMATVAPTIGLLPIPRKPIISTWAGTEEEPANCASECIRPMVSVIP